MIQRLDTLPFDVFYHIATSLDDRDLIHLSRVNRALHSITQSEQIARKTVEVLSPFLTAIGLAPSMLTSRRMAYSTARKVRRQ